MGEAVTCTVIDTTQIKTPTVSRIRGFMIVDISSGYNSDFLEYNIMSLYYKLSYNKNYNTVIIIILFCSHTKSFADLASRIL